jgi:large subunit ribosomal protein L21
MPVAALTAAHGWTNGGALSGARWAPFCRLGRNPAKAAFETNGLKTMFAVVRTGGKQYRVAAGDRIAVEKLAGEAGDTIELGDVLLAGDGDDLKDAAKVKVAAEIIAQAKSEKVLVFKKRRRHNYRRKNGHRQQLTLLRIVQVGDSKVETAGKAAAPKQAEAPVQVEAAPQAEAKAPAKKAAAPKAEAEKPAAKKAAAETKPAAAKAAPKSKK